MKETRDSNKENTTTQDTLIKTLGAFPTFDLNSIVQNQNDKNDKKSEKFEIPSASETTNKIQNEENAVSMSDISESFENDGKENLESETNLASFKPNNESKIFSYFLNSLLNF